MGPTGNTRVVQIHPTRRCNLRCLHCYSSSSPDERGMLDKELLLGAVSDAARAGYNWASISGGEPLMYTHLVPLLAHARTCGLRTAIATNGMLLDARRVDAIAEVVDLIAISVDGVPESHNTIRDSARAFDLMASRLQGLRERGLNFGFIFTLTQHNLHELQWVVQFALEQGARLVQVHPLDGVGHAETRMTGASPDEIETAYAWLMGRQLQKAVQDRLAIHVDLVSSAVLKSQPERIFAAPRVDRHEMPFADIVTPLVIEADATVVPLQYGFPRTHALGNLHEAPLARLVAAWRREREAAFYALCRATYDGLVSLEQPRFVSWYDEVARCGHRSAQRELHDKHAVPV